MEVSGRRGRWCRGRHGGVALASNVRRHGKRWKILHELTTGGHDQPFFGLGSIAAAIALRISPGRRSS
jgi:hypothetical protein